MAAVCEVNLRQGCGSPLGFKLTGGSQFSMPLTVFEVSEGGRAHRAGVRPGDVLLRINGADAADLSLSDARHIIAAAGEHVRLSIYNLDDQELTESEELIKASILSADEDERARGDRSSSEGRGEILHEDLSQTQYVQSTILKVDDTDKSEASVENSIQQTSFDINLNAFEKENNIETASNIEKGNIGGNKRQRKDNSLNINSEVAIEDPSLKVIISVSDPMATSQEQFDDDEYVDVRSLPLRPPQPAPAPEKAQRRCWHPVMWETSPPPGADADADADAEEESTQDGTRRREYPHKQRIRNLRRLMAEGKVKAEPETLIFFLCNKFAVSEERKNKLSA